MYLLTLLDAERFFFLVNDKSGLKVHLASRPDCFSAALDVLVGYYSWNLTCRSPTLEPLGIGRFRFVSDSWLSWFSAASVVRFDSLVRKKGDFMATGPPGFFLREGFRGC